MGQPWGNHGFELIPRHLRSEVLLKFLHLQPPEKAFGLSLVKKINWWRREHPHSLMSVRIRVASRILPASLWVRWFTFLFLILYPLRVCPWHGLGQWPTRGTPYPQPPEKFHLTSEFPNSKQNKPRLNFTQKKHKQNIKLETSASGKRMLHNFVSTSSNPSSPRRTPGNCVCARSGLSLTIRDLG